MNALRTPPVYPRWFPIVCVLAVLWSLVGVASLFADLATTPEALAKMPEAQRALYEARPKWMLGVYAVSVFGSLAGSAALLMRRKIARPVLIAAFAAIIVQFGYVFLAMNAFSAVGAAGLVLPAAVISIGAALVWLASHAAARGWLR